MWLGAHALKRTVSPNQYQTFVNGYASEKNVIDVIKELRKGVKDHHMPSPEKKPQIDMVISWSEGE